MHGGTVDTRCHSGIRSNYAQPLRTILCDVGPRDGLQTPRATGNVATKDLVFLGEGEGVEAGVDLDALIGVSEWLEGVLGRPLEGYVYRAGPWPPRTRPSA